MDWFSFIASLVGSLAWPTAVVVSVVVLKERLAALLTALGARIADLTKLSAMGINLEFEKSAEDLNRAAEQLLPSDNDMERPSGKDEARLAKLAEIDPRAAVLLAFIDVEAALRSVAETRVNDSRLHERWRRGASIGSIARELQRRDILTPQAAAVLSELASLRNQVSHDSTVRVSNDAAEKYIEAAGEIIQFLRNISNPDELKGPQPTRELS